RITEALPNVSVLDISEVQRAIEDVVSRAAQAISFMASFSLLTGAVVLIGAVGTSRRQRLLEAVLLRAVGATRGQVLRIVLAEYVCLGALAVGVALVLSSLAGWGLTHFVFDQRFVLPAVPMSVLGALIVAACVGVGLSGSRDALRRPPLETLRAE